MFRKKITYPYVREIKSSILWKDCGYCEIQFRKEKYYEITKQYVDGTFGTHYGCNHCFSSVNEVEAKLESIRNWMPTSSNKKPPTTKAVDTSTLYISEPDE